MRYAALNERFDDSVNLRIQGIVKLSVLHFEERNTLLTYDYMWLNEVHMNQKAVKFTLEMFKLQIKLNFWTKQAFQAL